MPLPKGHAVLSKGTTTGDAAWFSQQEDGYEFRLAEYTDGTTALYRVNPDGSIYLDKDSVLVREMFCLHCGEQMNTALDAATGTPDPYDYYCAACGHHVENSKEDE